MRETTSGASEVGSGEFAPSSRTEPRLVDAWCEWLGALATNAEAALSAAIAYRDLNGPGRDGWLHALEQDSGRVNVPKIAIYAPLLAVEADPERRSRITAALGTVDESVTPSCAARALAGRAADGARIATLVMPLYLDFVQVLACAYREDRGFFWVRHDPIVDGGQAPQHGESLDGVLLESAPLKPLIDDLAHAVLAHRRSGRELPEALCIFADLFRPSVDNSTFPPPP